MPDTAVTNWEVRNDLVPAPFSVKAGGINGTLDEVVTTAALDVSVDRSVAAGTYSGFLWVEFTSSDGVKVKGVALSDLRAIVE
jgi:hypothetical protein